jgi:hypothetical protein
MIEVLEHLHGMLLAKRFIRAPRERLHRCLVFELFGPSLSSEAESCASGRLAGYIAWEVASQTTQAFAYIHAMSVAHGGQSAWGVEDDCRPNNLNAAGGLVATQIIIHICIEAVLSRVQFLHST